MKAYKQIEMALLPEMKVRMAGRTTMAKRVIRLTLLEWPTASMPESETDDNKRTIKLLCSGMAGVIQERYKQEYGEFPLGTSIVLMFILGLLIQIAIKKLLEWWFEAETRSVMKEAIVEVKETDT